MTTNTSTSATWAWPPASCRPCRREASFDLLPDRTGWKCVSSAAFFDGKIWVGASSPRFHLLPLWPYPIQVLTLAFDDPQQPDKSISIENGDAANVSNWTRPAVSIPGIGVPISDAAPAFAATSDKLFLIWGQAVAGTAPDG